MARITTGFSFTPPLSSTTSTSKRITSSLSLASSQSNAFGLRLWYRSSLGFVSFRVLSAVRSSISARYGGPPSSGPGDPRRSAEEQALDISSIRSDVVRLIDEQQNMVGILSKAEAIRMAENSELDLVIFSPDADRPVVRMMDYNESLGFEGAQDVEQGSPLPKFGEWDVKDPTSAEEFTVIFNNARNEKKAGGKPGSPGASDFTLKEEAILEKPHSDLEGDAC